LKLGFLRVKTFLLAQEPDTEIWLNFVENPAVELYSSQAIYPEMQWGKELLFLAPH
jgi:hypothetical protein